MEKNQLKIFRSSAGSGKTRTLVFHFVSLLLINPEHYRNILAVTFTNKATQEMKDRVISLLVNLVEKKDDQELADISELSGINATEVAKRANIALKNILHDYSSFSVSTIDSFFNGIIRSMAIELSLPLRYDIELKQEKIVDDLLRELYSTLKTDSALLNWLERYVEFRLLDKRTWDPESSIKEIAQQIFSEKFRYFSDEDLQKPDKKQLDALFSIVSSFTNKIHEFAAEFLSEAMKENLVLTDFTSRNSSIGFYFQKLAENERISVSDIKFSASAKKGIEDGKWFTKSNAHTNAFEERFLNPFADRYAKFLDKETSNFVTAKKLLDVFYLKGILSFLKEGFDKYKSENNIIHISDNNKLLKDLISEEDAPFIYERSGNKYFHYLIDEFQDTSSMQWENLEPLVSNSLASGNFAMIVGDAKQSIYRWRGGNVELLLTKVENDLNSFQSIIKEENLATNYRSARQIVEFNNWFFNAAIQELSSSNNLHNKEVLLNAYDNKSLQQKVSPKNETEEAYVMLSKKPSELKADDYSIEVGEEIAELIEEYRSLQYRLQDMCILVRNQTDGKRIAEFLSNKNYKIITSDALHINNSGTVAFVINIFKIIQNELDFLAVAEALHFYLIGIKKQNIDKHNLFSLHRNNVEELFSFFPKQFRTAIGTWKQKNVYEVFEGIIKTFQLEDFDDAFLQHLREEIIEFGLIESGSISEFIEYWQEKLENDKETLDISDDKDAVRIMTIHKSKGLQFPIVFIPFTNWSITPKSGSTVWSLSAEQWNIAPGIWPLYYDEQLLKSHFSNIYTTEYDFSILDNLNLLYVAFTRAEKILNIWTKSLPKNVPDKMKNANHLISTIMKEHFVDDIYESGTLNNFIPKKEDKKETIDIIPIKYDYPDRFLRLKRKDDEDFGSEAIEYGNLFHDFMSYIEYSTDAEKVYSDIKGREDLEQHTKSQLLKDISKAVTSNLEMKWFSSEYQILNEPEILLPSGKAIRPDRLMLKKKECVILDYKTGSESINDINKHSKQVLTYCKALQEMGYTSVAAYLYYVEIGELKEIN